MVCLMKASTLRSLSCTTAFELKQRSQEASHLSNGRYTFVLNHLFDFPGPFILAVFNHGLS